MDSLGVTAVSGTLIRFRDDDPRAAPYPQPMMMDSFLEDAGATAVRLAPEDDARALVPHLDRLALVEIAFPTFRDGRGYSAARVLREAGYAGELRAVGDVLVDQLPFMRRCGFDSFVPDQPLDADALARALERYAYHYQPAADAAVPVWRRRHG